MSEIKAGDIIRHKSVPRGMFDVEVLEVLPTCADGEPHPSFKIIDPESGEPDTVCSRDFMKVGA